MNAGQAVDKKKYGKLLAKAQPAPIETDEENERLTAEAHRLESKSTRSPEEEMLLELIDTLIEAYEEKHYQFKQVAPHEIVQELMLARDLRQSDLVKLIGSRGAVSDMVNGKRQISKRQARLLSSFFHVSQTLFLCPEEF